MKNLPIEMDTAVCKEVIISTLKRRGSGQPHSPVRIITEVYEKDGTLIAEFDPSPETFTKKDLLDFALWAAKNDIKPDLLSNSSIIKWLDSINN